MTDHLQLDGWHYVLPTTSNLCAIFRFLVQNATLETAVQIIKLIIMLIFTDDIIESEAWRYLNTTDPVYNCNFS